VPDLDDMARLRGVPLPSGRATWDACAGAYGERKIIVGSRRSAAPVRRRRPLLGGRRCRARIRPGLGRGPYRGPCRPGPVPGSLARLGTAGPGPAREDVTDR